MDMEEKEEMKDSNTAMRDINLRAIYNRLSDISEEWEKLSPDTRNMLKEFALHQLTGDPQHMRSFMKATASFLSDLLRGEYDTAELGLDVFNGILYVSTPGHGDEIYNQYVRGINAG